MGRIFVDRVSGYPLLINSYDEFGAGEKAIIYDPLMSYLGNINIIVGKLKYPFILLSSKNQQKLNLYAT